MRGDRIGEQETTSKTARRRLAVALAAAGALLAGIGAASVPAAIAGSGHGGVASARAATAGTGRPASGHQAAFRPRHGKFLGVIPDRRAAAAAAAAGQAGPAANGKPPLTYHGGPVQHASNVYAIFWQPAGFYYSPAYRAAVGQYFTDLSHDSYRKSNVYAAATQYYDKTGPGGTRNWVSYNVSFAGSALVKDALPTGKCANYTMGDGTKSRRCLTDGQLETEISKVVAAQGWPTGLSDEFFLFTPKQLGDCFDTRFADGCYDPSANSSTAFCAYHSWIGTKTLYAVLPWADQTGGCQYNVPHSPLPNDVGADVAVNLISHEQNETMTDPLGTGWLDKSGFENGDECAWLAVPAKYNGVGDFSQVMNGTDYLMQDEWSNRAGKCVAANTYPQPAGSFTGTPSGLQVSFAASASDSDDTAFTYGWNFGDGHSAQTSAANASHTYASAGTYQVRLVIFDAHGDQVTVVRSVVVA